MIDAGLYLSYVLLFVAIAVAIVFPLLYFIKHPGGLVKSLMGIGGLVVVFIICYLLSGSEVTAKYASLGVGAGSSKLIGAGLMMFYVTLVIALVGLVYSEISKALK